MDYCRYLSALVVAAAPTALAAPGHAADIVATAEEAGQFQTLLEAANKAGLADTLGGEGPYTLFAPTDAAFEQLPDGALDQLLNADNREQLKTLLENHLIEGDAISASGLIGKETKLDTMAGQDITADGTGTTLMLVPLGLKVTRVGDQVFVERDMAALASASVDVKTSASTSAETGAQRDEATTAVTKDAAMPATKHQQEVLKTEPEIDQQQTAPEENTMLETEAEKNMPATLHQQQVLTDNENKGEKGALREANVVQADIKADNGVIHVIDAVLVPQEILPLIENDNQQ